MPCPISLDVDAEGSSKVGLYFLYRSLYTYPSRSWPYIYSMQFTNISARLSLCVFTVNIVLSDMRCFRH